MAHLTTGTGLTSDIIHAPLLTLLVCLSRTVFITTTTHDLLWISHREKRETLQTQFNQTPRLEIASGKYTSYRSVDLPGN